MNNEAQHSNDIGLDKLISKAKNNSAKDMYDTKKEPRKSMGVYLKNQNRLIGYIGVMVPPISVKWCHFERYCNYS